LLILLMLPLLAEAQPISQNSLVEHADMLAVQASAMPPSSRVRIVLLKPAPADTTTHWSGRGQIGLNWTEGARDIVLITVQHAFFFQAPPYEAYAGVSGTASWTDIFTQDTDEIQTQHVYRYALDLHGQRALSKRVYALTNIVWLSDPNQGIERQLYTGAGTALILKKNPTATLRAQATGGYLHEREVSDEHLDTPAASMALNLALRLAHGSQLAFHAEAIDNLSEPEDLLLRVHGSLTAPLGKHFGLTLSVDLSHDLLPAASYFEEDGEGELVSITPSAFSAFVATGLSIQW